ncbi:MAG: DUF3999 family protein [Silvibacterium sp.]
MTLRPATLLLLIATAAPSTRYFRYDRAVLNTPPQAQQACLILDPATFAHAGRDLSSLRLYSGETETPYAINYAEPVQSSAKSITPLNLGLRTGAASFDAAMPDGPYSNLDLAVDAHDFIATVRVTGSQTQSGTTTSLGSYTIFDFTRQKLGRSTVLHLPASDFHYLHFRIEGPIRPVQITGLNTERLLASQPQYVTVATATAVQQQNRDTFIRFTVPVNVPVDRILFTPGPQPVSFSRDVTITIAPAVARPATDAEEPLPPTVASGNLLRIHSIQNGRKIDEEHLAIDSPYQTFNTGTKWTIAIHNEDDAPLTLKSVSLQMVARTLCFSAQPDASYSLYYGDKALATPHYDYATLFTLDKDAARATLGPEQPNPQYQPRPDTRPFTEKHPALLWIALIAAIFLLGVIALRSSKQLKQS